MSRANPHYFILHDLIARGNLNQARHALQSLSLSKIPRPQAARLAEVARRCGLPNRAIEILFPIVRSTRTLDVSPTVHEKTEYALALTRIGALEEAEFVISSLESTQPMVLFCQVAILVGQWRYRESIPILQRYVKSSSINQYEKWVGQLNLAAALVNEREHKKALTLLEELQKQLWRKRAILLYANSLELLAQSYFHQQDWKNCDFYLTQAESYLKYRSHWDSFFIQKLRVFSLLLQGENRWDALSELREKSQRASHWETVRDCDRFSAIAKGDKSLLERVYFGSPYDGFRHWMLHDWKDEVELPSSYLWNLESHPAQTTLDLEKGLVVPGDHLLEPGSQIQRILYALSQDFYRPTNLATLHARLFPGECYNPHSSPTRVHKALSRFRSWFSDRNLSLRVASEGGLFHLEAANPTAIRIPLSKQRSKLSWFVAQLEEKFGRKPFRCQEVAKLCQVSTRTARRHLDNAIIHGHLKREGQGRATIYLLRN